MRYIRKQTPPSCFSDLVKLASDSTQWSELQNPCKAKLRERILVAEQQRLCIYCERGIEQDKHGHLEHMEPQSVPGRRFDYANIVVSCNGGDCGCEHHHGYDGLDIKSCGHRKGGDFDSTRFLNPTQLSNIAEYFEYDHTSGAIKASKLDPESANYMINELLHLDNPFLNHSRLNARNGLMRAIRAKPQLSKPTMIAKLLLAERPFISFLRSCYPARTASRNS